MTSPFYSFQYKTIRIKKNIRRMIYDIVVEQNSQLLEKYTQNETLLQKNNFKNLARVPDLNFPLFY